jgi:hypothetical protein
MTPLPQRRLWNGIARDASLVSVAINFYLPEAGQDGVDQLADGERLFILLSRKRISWFGGISLHPI